MYNRHLQCLNETHKQTTTKKRRPQSPGMTSKQNHSGFVKSNQHPGRGGAYKDEIRCSPMSHT